MKPDLSPHLLPKVTLRDLWQARGRPRLARALARGRAAHARWLSVALAGGGEGQGRPPEGRCREGRVIREPRLTLIEGGKAP